MIKYTLINCFLAWSDSDVIKTVSFAWSQKNFVLLKKNWYAEPILLSISDKEECEVWTMYIF